MKLYPMCIVAALLALWTPANAKRSTSTVKMAFRHLNMNINWTRENLEFQSIFNAFPKDYTFQTYNPTTLPTLKYQRGVNFTVYEMNIRKEQAKIQKVIDERQADIDKRRAKWMSIKGEMKAIRSNMSHIRKSLHNNSQHQQWLERKKKLIRDLKDLKIKHNVTEQRGSYEIAYERARVAVIRLLKKHTRFYMNKTKYFYEFILRKNELSDELYDLRDNITKLDMIVNENMEKETVAPNIVVKDILTNLSDTIKSINMKGYKYRKTKRGMQFLISIMNKWLNRSKAMDLEKKSRLPPLIIKTNNEIRNLTAQLKVGDPRIQHLKNLLKDKSVEYHDVKYYFYRKALNLRELEMEHFVWEMNLTNFLKERVRQDLLEIMATPDHVHYLRDESSIEVKDNLFMDMIDQEKYWRGHLRYNKTTTAPYEWQEVLAFDEECKKYMHDNWFSFEHLRDKYGKRKRRKRHIRDTRKLIGCSGIRSAHRSVF